MKNELNTNLLEGNGNAEKKTAARMWGGIELGRALKMWQRFAIVLLILLCAFLSSCTPLVNVNPNQELSLQIESEELLAHVHYLAQPAMKGRKPKTRGSKKAREYIKKRFEASGLVPWGECKGYEQPFGFGTNVIGVMPRIDNKLD